MDDCAIAFEQTKEVAKGSLWGIIGTVALKLISFAYAIYIARVFSQEDIGLFYLSLSVIWVVGFWKDLGIPTALHRYVPFFEAKRQWGKIISLIKISFAVELFLGLLLAVLILLLAEPISEFYGNSRLAEGLSLLSAYVLFENLSKVAFFYLQGRGDIKAVQLMQNAQNLARLILTVLFFSVFGAVLFSLAAAFVLSFVISFLLGFLLVLRKTDFQKAAQGEGISNSEVLTELAPFGITLTIINSFLIIISSTDRVLLGYFGSSGAAMETVAIYTIATQLALTIGVFPNAIGSIFLPVVSRLIGKGEHKAMLQVIQTSQRWVLFVTIPIAILAIAFSSEMLSAFYGKNYAPGSAAMSIFIAGMMFSSLSYMTSLALTGMRLIQLELKVAATCAAANVALNFALIPPFGMEGAAIASALSFLISAVMLERYGRAYLSYKTPAGLYKLFFAGALALAGLVLIKPIANSAIEGLPAFEGELAGYAYKFAYLFVFALAGAFGLALFLLASLALKSFKREDVSILRAAAKKAKAPDWLILFAEKIAMLGTD